tara:strand:+ start:1933 stop:2868 length:936 start_codon:yes stop_codon:yes gene_type:complete
MIKDKLNSSANFGNIIKNIFKYIFFKKLTLKSSNLFLKGGDIISIWPQTSGVHEKVFSELICKVAKNGHSDFLIDIGANIGLTCCQTGNEFKKIICFEPNPLCMHILKVNTEIALDTNKIELFEFGLGKTKEELELWIPKHNWGGGFIKSDSNIYDKDILAKKDGFLNIDKSNYSIRKVKIESTEDQLSKNFSNLTSENFTNGIIKIDVEGMEETVIEGISKSLLPEMRIYIFFENWDQEFNFDMVKQSFENRDVEIFKISSKISERFVFLQKFSIKLHKLFTLIFNFRKSYLININECINKTGDIVICVK